MIGRDIFDFFFETTEWNSMKPDRKQDLNVLYVVFILQAAKWSKIVTLANL